MEIKSATFVTSVADFKKYPESELSEVTFVGRSNVGKSSLINLLVGQKALARTSSTPGCTRLINLFDINRGQFLLVDLPGYGFQAGGRRDAESWSKLIEEYLEFRMQLKHAFLLLDIRHKPSVQDEHMIKYFNYLRIPFSVIATKADQISKTRIRAQIQMLDSVAGVGIDNIIPVSAVKKTGRERVLERIGQALSLTEEEDKD